MLRTVGPQGSLFELSLPAGMRVLSGELAKIDALLDEERPEHCEQPSTISSDDGQRPAAEPVPSRPLCSCPTCATSSICPPTHPVRRDASASNSR